jgi:hypothetical protein
LEETWLFEHLIFEQLLISSAEIRIMVWNLWSRKEAAYKIYNRATGIRGFPLNLECAYENSTTGPWLVRDIHSIMKTVIDAEKIHTIAVTCKKDFKLVKVLGPT